MNDSIFTKIIKGEIPSYKIYEDNQTFAFLDIHPKKPGHTLVVPKKQVEFLWDLDEEDYEAVLRTVRRVANRIKEVLGAPYVGMLVVGIDVPHAHIHVYPFNSSAESQYIPDQNAPPDNEALSKIAKIIAF
jgi:histidine triad (HIT) family protein